MDASRWGVLVGTDGSDSGMRAVEWAAADAAAADVPLTVAHVADLPILVGVPWPRDLGTRSSGAGTGSPPGP